MTIKRCGEYTECGGCNGRGGCEECGYTGRIACPCENGDSMGRARAREWRHAVASNGTECHDCGEQIAAGMPVLIMAMSYGSGLTFGGCCQQTGSGGPAGMRTLPVA
jgi:hypothetical protein